MYKISLQNPERLLRKRQKTLGGTFCRTVYLCICVFAD